MVGIILGLLLAVFMGLSLHFLNTTSSIKGENLVLKGFGKKTIVPIKEVVSVECIDMIRSFQATIRTKTEVYYVTFGYDMEGFMRKIEAVNPYVRMKVNNKSVFGEKK